MNDRIAAISTPIGIGGIAIIRISGPGSIDLINTMVDIDLTKKEHNTINYAKFFVNNTFFDEVLVSIFKMPNSFTGEEIVEINTHGGIYVANKALKYIVSKEDTRLAQPGEFSKRAFLNGKKTLTETQAIDQIINAKTKYAHELALNQFSNKTNELIENMRQNLLELITQIEVNIDYPEYEDIHEFNTKELLPKVKIFIKQIRQIISDSKKGELVRNGIDTAIIGAPNVGKSTLLNRLTRKDSAIVTEIEGTTRDIVRTEVQLDNIILNLADTAGIRNTKDKVEALGIEKSIKQIEEATLILFIIDGSRKLTDEEKNLYINQIRNKNHIVVINKLDLEQTYNIDESLFKNIVKISAKKDINIDDLENEILRVIGLIDYDPTTASVVANANDIIKLENILDTLKEIETLIKEDQVIDLIELELKEVLYTLGEILQIDAKSNLIDELFERFCLGK